VSVGDYSQDARKSGLLKTEEGKMGSKLNSCGEQAGVAHGSPQQLLHGDRRCYDGRCSATESVSPGQLKEQWGDSGERREVKVRRLGKLVSWNGYEGKWQSVRILGEDRKGVLLKTAERQKEDVGLQPLELRH